MKGNVNHLKANQVFSLVIFAVLLFCAFAPTVAAFAHDVQPTKSEPAAGAVLAQAPAKVTVWFPEEVVEDKSSLKVFDAQGKQVDDGKGGVDLNDASHQVLVVGVRPLSEGVYTVRWSIGLTDGDASAGSFMFGVGNVTVPTAVPEAAEPEATPPASSSLPVWVYAGGTVIAAVVILGVVWFFISKAKPSA